MDGETLAYNGRMKTETFKVEGMSCSHCQSAVAKALHGVAGVSTVEVDLERRQATVAFDPAKADESKLAAAVADAGYALVLR